jgi:hypothetical protein
MPVALRQALHDRQCQLSRPLRAPRSVLQAGEVFRRPDTHQTAFAVSDGNPGCGALSALQRIVAEQNVTVLGEDVELHGERTHSPPPKGHRGFDSHPAHHSLFQRVPMRSVRISPIPVGRGLRDFSDSCKLLRHPLTSLGRWG